ncbi:prostaglandin E2 receptor EP4 subtype-like [Ostrea edulis]|uniref:prostaglandin E2 receptor EP4 subtype-like n=1 Tax=Ostrea edulis TaxID=37623 RepID=UPI002094C470|nr:prostaglandin E2 receptor EP4 subtype-like [Ostrea edulis]XP_048739493.1 prostaglandin E2 receptor EP4 subtype-like [Ostrea edulis]XP_055999594.1 prostaglandin E2 receptor EP4 subtype-like [Ostrea edulis]
MTVNCTKYDPFDSSWVPVCIEFCLGTIGNILALVILWISRRHNGWRPFDKMFAGLALDNLLSIMLTDPFIFKRYTSGSTWSYNQTLCDFNSFLLVNNHLSSAFLICAMSIDQFLIAREFEKETGSSGRREGKRYTIMVFVLMIVSASISLLYVTGLSSSRLVYPETRCYLDFICREPYIFTSLSISLILLTVIFNVLSIWKFYKNPYLRSMARYSRTGRNQCCSNMSVFVVVISVVFFVLWTPFLVLMIVPEALDEEVLLWFLRIANLNTVIEPWLYIFLRREAFGRIVHRCIQSRRGYAPLDSTPGT